MNDIRTVLRIAAGRLNLASYLERLHAVAVLVAALALAVILAAKAAPQIALPWTWVAPSLAAAAAAVAFIAWWRSRRTDVQVAIAVDERLELREKLSTALHVADRSDAFARAAVEDAVQVAKDARTREAVRRRFPVDPPRRWWLSPMLVAVAVLAALFIPQGDLFAKDSTVEQKSTPIPVEVQSTLDSAVESIKQSDALKDELADVFEELDVDKLDPNAIKTPEGAKREALKKLTDLSDRLDEITKGEKGKTAEALQDALDKLNTPSEDSAVSELTKAMKDGNFEAAKAAVEKLQKMAESGELSPQQKDKLSKDLQDLADQLAKLAEDRKAMEDALKDAGVDPNLAKDPQALQQALQQNQNLTQQQKQQLQQMAQAQQQASQMCQGMAGAMGQMAQGMQGNGQQGGKGSQQMGQMLTNAEAMEQMLKEAKALANKVAGQCKGLGQGLGQCQGLGMGNGGAFGGPGQGAGGEAPIAKTPTSTKTEKADSQDNNADVIASTMFDGPIIKGESTAAFRNAALSQADSYADGVRDEQIPRKYHDALQQYFGELREKAKRAMAGDAQDAGDDAESTGDEGGEDAEGNAGG